jgi:hypothetical protein
MIPTVAVKSARLTEPNTRPAKVQIGRRIPGNALDRLERSWGIVLGIMGTTVGKSFVLCLRTAPRGAISFLKTVY